MIGKYIYTVLIGLLFTFCGCTNWLDVTSKSEVDVDEMFETSEGYYSVITGLYVNMGSIDLYGGNMNIIGLEPLNQQYLIVQNTDRESWFEFNYTNSNYEKVRDNIWLKMYNNIVNANILLEQLKRDEHPYFEDGVLDIIKGEALGLRAYMYFDLFRLFNESWEVNQNSNNIPFKTDFSFEIGTQVTSAYLLQQIKNDLVEAQRLLLERDPIVSGKSYKDKYILYDRTQRMNYYAVTALLARINMHTANYKEAYENALIVIRSDKFRFIEEEEIIQRDIYGNLIKADRVFMPEMVFALYSTDFLTSSRGYLEGLGNDFLKSDACYSGSDLRQNWLYVNPSANNRLQLIRFQQSQSSEDVGIYSVPVVPMLKLSEMYLIVAEGLLKDNTLSGSAEEYLNTFKLARKAELLQAGASEGEIMSEITHEYICDFKGEGQLFLYYKRLNLERIDDGYYNGNSYIMDIANYTFPLPQYEIDFGYGK